MRRKKRSMFAVAMGNCIEVYDYSHFIYFSSFIGMYFFPQAKQSETVLFVLWIYAIEHMLKPIAGIVIGCIADQNGRKKILTLSVLGMVFISFIICFIPSYSYIGIYSALLLLLCRTMQGLFISGEFVTAIAYITECGSTDSKGLAGSISFLSGISGVLLSSFIALLTFQNLSVDEIQNFGWKIPYLLGIILLLGTYKFRKNILETPEYNKNKFNSFSIINSIKIYKKDILYSFLLTSFTSTTFAIFIMYMPTHLIIVNSLDIKSSMKIGCCSLFLYASLLPILGLLSDKIGKERLMLISSSLILLFTYPIYQCLNFSSNKLLITTAILISMILVVALNASLPALLCELFPVRDRVKSLAVGFGLSRAIFAGIAPLICIYLPKITGLDNAAAFYIMILASLTIFLLYKRINLNKIGE